MDDERCICASELAGGPWSNVIDDMSWDSYKKSSTKVVPSTIKTTETESLFLWGWFAIVRPTWKYDINMDNLVLLQY